MANAKKQASSQTAGSGMIIIKTNQSGPITKPIPLTCEDVDGITVCIDAEEAARKAAEEAEKRAREDGGKPKHGGARTRKLKYTLSPRGGRPHVQ